MTIAFAAQCIKCIRHIGQAEICLEEHHVAVVSYELTWHELPNFLFAVVGLFIIAAIIDCLAHTQSSNPTPSLDSFLRWTI